MKPLSARTLKVIEWKANGKTDDEVAEIMEISISTVHSHLRKSYDRTGTPFAAALVAMALRKGWIE